MELQLVITADLLKARTKGSRNKEHSYVAVYKDSHGNDHYIYAHEKETDEEGKLKSGVKAASIIRRHFGAETPGDRERRLALGIKDKAEEKWAVDPYTKNPVQLQKPSPVVTQFEVSPVHKREFRNGLPDNIKQFFTSDEELARIKVGQTNVPIGGGEKFVHVYIPGTDKKGKPLLDINEEPVIVGQETVNTKDLTDLAYTPVPVVTEEKLEIKTKKIDKPAGYGTGEIEKLLANPLIQAKYGDDIEALQKDARERPFTLWMTAGLMGGHKLHPNAMNAVLDEWQFNISKIVRAETSRFKNTVYYTQKESDQELPQPKGGSAEHYIKQSTNDYINDIALQALTDWLPNYKAEVTDPHKRFDKYFASKIENYVKGRIRRDLKERGAETALTGEESDLGRPDVSQGSMVMSPHEAAEYRHYAPLGRSRIEEVLGDMPEAQRRVVEARLWLDSGSESEERDEIVNRVGAEDEEQAKLGPARATFERSFQAILEKYPDGWPFKVDLSTEGGKDAARKALTRLYDKAIHRLARRLTASTIDEKLAHEGKTHGLVHDAHTNTWYTKQNYAAKRYLELEAKRLQTGKSVPTEREHYTKEGQGPSKYTVTAPNVTAGTPSKIKELIPAVGYFEKKPDLAQRLGFHKWGPIKVPTWMFSRKTSGKPQPQNVEHVIYLTHHKYGLPQTEHAAKPMRMTEEQSRRFHSMRDAYTFMLLIGNKQPNELHNLRKRTVTATNKVNEALGAETPLALASTINVQINRLNNPNVEVREAAAKKLVKHAKRLYVAEHYSGIDPTKQVASQIVELASTDVKEPKIAERVYQALSKVTVGATAAAIDATRRKRVDYIKMLDYEMESRKADKPMAKAIDFVTLLHDLDFAIGKKTVAYA